jgi:hypothetical protein
MEIKPSPLSTLYIFRWAKKSDITKGVDVFRTTDSSWLVKIFFDDGDWRIKVDGEYFMPDENNEFIIKVRVCSISTNLAEITQEQRHLATKGDMYAYNNAVTVMVEKVK